MLSSLGRFLLIAGILLALTGLYLMLQDRLPRAGRLPGDILIRRPGFTFYFPLGACLVASAVLTLLFWLMHLLRR